VLDRFAPRFFGLMAVLLAGGVAMPANAREQPQAERGNTVLVRPARRWVLGAAAVARVPVLVGMGREVMQPAGFGFAFQLRFHAIALGALRLGFEAHFGHNQFMQRHLFVHVPEVGAVQSVSRRAALAHTDLSLGPSLQIPIRRVFLELGGSVGLAISNFVRPVSAMRDENITAYDPVIRGALQLGIPIQNNHGMVVGFAVQQIYSKTTIVADPTAPPGTTPDNAPFDLLIEPYAGYQAWF